MASPKRDKMQPAGGKVLDSNDQIVDLTAIYQALGLRVADTSATMQSAVAATGNGTVLAVTGMSTAVIQIAGTFVANINFEGTIDGVTWVPVYAVKLGARVSASVATDTGLYRLIVAGLVSVRARVTWTSGTSVTVTGRATSAASLEELMVATLADRIEGEDQNRHILNIDNTALPTRVTTATTSVIQLAAGAAIHLIIESVLTGTLTFYDATSATGTPWLILPIGFAAGSYILPARLGTGMTVVSSASDRWVAFAKN